MQVGRPKAKYSQALRILRIVEMLQHRGSLTISRLMDEFQIDRRTVQRDINVLRDAYAIEEETNQYTNEKLFRLASSSRTETLKLTITEMVSLYMSRNFFRFLDGTDLYDAIDSVYSKLQTRLSQRNAKVREKLPKKFYSTTGFPKAYHGSDDLINDVLTCLIEERKMRFTYRRPGRSPYEDVMHPYTLVAHNQSLYCIGFSERASAQRMFALERIHDTSWRGLERFAYPNDYDPADHFAESFGITASGKRENIKLHFSSEVAGYVAARQWHPTMTTQQKKDGTLEVGMKVSINEELLHWIAGYGGKVVVRSPVILRQLIADRHRAGAANNAD